MTTHLTISEALQRAVVTRLSEDAALMTMIDGVFDTVPLSTAFPYVTIAILSVADLSNTGIQVSEVRFAVHIWSEYAGSAEVLAIMKRIEMLLIRDALALLTGSLISLSLRQSETRMDADALKRWGRMQYRGLIAAM
jgi:Protein of unknown function (DUF3168)